MRRFFFPICEFYCLIFFLPRLRCTTLCLHYYRSRCETSMCEHKTWFPSLFIPAGLVGRARGSSCSGIDHECWGRGTHFLKSLEEVQTTPIIACVCIWKKNLGNVDSGWMQRKHFFLFTGLEVSAKGWRLGLGKERDPFVSALIFRIIDADFACWREMCRTRNKI